VADLSPCSDSEVSLFPRGAVTVFTSVAYELPNRRGLVLCHSLASPGLHS
jgi:hypothetical protein